ncbi:MAG: UDP-3-O-(3-hydroxymyristoyl)glucosamine N-acyltransferase [Flavobacteriales bacterium]
MNFSSLITALNLAAKVGGECLNNGSLELTGLNEIHRVTTGDVTFCDNAKYLKAALNSDASCILVNQKSDFETEKALILVDKPFEVFSQLSKDLRAFSSSNEMIHSSVNVGEGTVIMPGVFIGANSSVGKNCLIHPNVTIYDNCHLGDNVIIHSGTIIGADAFYYQKTNGYNKLHSCGDVKIEDNVEIGASCTIDRGVTSTTVVGSGTKIDNMVQIGHDTVVGNNCLFASQVGIAGVVTVEDDVILWGQVGVQKDLTIGKGAVVLGQSGLAKSLEGGITYFGSPVREAREKMRELALIKQLPSIIRELKQ